MGAADRVGARGTHDLRRQVGGRELLAGTARTDAQHRDEVVRLDESGLDTGLDAERHGRHVAARHRDPLRRGELGALPTEAGDVVDVTPLVGGPGSRGRVEQLRQPVGPRTVVLAAVERVPRRRVRQPVVRAAVDDEGVVVELGRDGPGLPVRQREEHHVVPAQVRRRRLHQRQVCQRPQVRLRRDERLPRVREGRHRPDVELGVGGEHTQELSARVAGGSRHGDGYGHGFHLWSDWSSRESEAATPGGADPVDQSRRVAPNRSPARRTAPSRASEASAAVSVRSVARKRSANVRDFCPSSTPVPR